jgi:hypothetical protein
MNDLIPEIRHDGPDLPGRTNPSYDADGRRGAPEAGRHGLPEIEPVPEVDLRERGLRPAGEPTRVVALGLEELVERSLRQAALWDEVKDRLDRSALGLSGGQQQRLCIARALAVSPEVILMDEPASALDPIATQKIEELMYELKEHYTILIVTHNMQQAARVSDYTAFFFMGKLIEVGKTEDIFTNPRRRSRPRPTSPEGSDEPERAARHFHQELADLKSKLLEMSGTPRPGAPLGRGLRAAGPGAGAGRRGPGRGSTPSSSRSTGRCTSCSRSQQPMASDLRFITMT